MRGDGRPAADVEIAASVRAAELRFHVRPEVHVRFTGVGARESRQETRRENIDSPVQPEGTHLHVFAATRISSRLLEADGDVSLQ
jgi:hypothetical protein